ncbi:transcriptional regulator [Acinetobacter pittii]|uniref:transcriptional regulator n=1 Tax=Acinetobacter pittii TaxID=48296 RepID=UPI00301B7E07
MPEQIEPEVIRISPEQLQIAGRILYGQQWQTDFARAVKVDPRRVRQWLSGDRPIPPGIRAEVVKLLLENSQNALSFANILQNIE